MLGDWQLEVDVEKVGQSLLARAAADHMISTLYAAMKSS